MENKNTIELNVVRLGGKSNGRVPTKLSEMENDCNFIERNALGTAAFKNVEDLQGGGSNKNLYSFTQTIDVNGSSSSINLITRRKDYTANYYEGLFVIDVPEGQSIKLIAYGEMTNATYELKAGLNYMQYNQLYSLNDGSMTYAHQCEVYTNNGEYNKAIIVGAGARSGVYYRLTSDTPIPTSVSITFFGGREEIQTGGM